MNHSLTPGADRVLTRAAIIAAAASATEVEPAHLLRSLLSEICRASEFLEQRGIDLASFDQTFPDVDILKNLEEVGGEDSVSDETIPQDRRLQMILTEARQRAAMQGHLSEIGTEHLLWGLLVVDSSGAEWLRGDGLHIDELTELFTAEKEESELPLETDVTLVPHEIPRTDLHDAYRILDAAANRAREGLRSIEDYVRFSLNDRHLSSLLKNWRHEFTAVMGRIDAGRLIAARETQEDVGTSITTAMESTRQSTLHVAQANFKRAQEAMRTLEEFGKTISGGIAAEFEQLRYRLYTLEKAVLTTTNSRERLADCHLYLLVTEALCHHGSGPAIHGALAGGVGIVQLREKELSDRRLVEMGLRIRAWTQAAGALFIMNDRPDLAVLTDADGVHVGQEELSVREARRIIGADKLVGVSTHNIDQARQAVLDGADYIGVGPTFPSRTKNFDDFAGLEFIRQVAAEISLPFYPIGGIDQNNIDEVVAAGATRAAVTGAICSDEHPERAAKELDAVLRGTVQ